MPTVKAGPINIHYETSGDGPPLLLIMGYGMPGTAWLPMIPFLPGFRCICFDNRGTGESDRPEGPYTIPDMADDASALLDAIGVARAKVYGISMGGMIAQELALRHPEKVEKLVLGCTTPGGASAKMAPPELLERLVGAVKLAAREPERSVDTLMPLLYPSDVIAAHPEIRDMILATMRLGPPTPPETADRAMAGIGGFDALDRLDRIRCPVLIVHGDKDLLLPPENALLLKSRIPHAELMMIPGAGHGYQASDPVGIHQRIVAWLNQRG